MSNNLPTIKERVLQIAEIKELSKKPFIESIGMTYGNFTGQAKNTPLNSDALSNILLKFPEINAEWLLTGKGEMIKEQSIQSSDDSEKLWNLINSQQKMLESQQRIIENLSQKGAAEGVTDVAQKAARG